MPWWPFRDDREPAAAPDDAPDPGGIFCTCCPAHLGRWRFPGSDVLVCAVCDNPPSEGST